ncbi:hypothetical protein AB3Z07_13340 [Metabacillus halosaccharovorans]|uniref:hypothetical protein n=1 Tax=Metabacillus halosaccharovorans TaxID=930124 RepID=UPI0020405F9B|nr:hypothetical protein [Metabacillus halosaccharovorans]MCM3439258.1 hypothetical protein [Metabacillus halosaccharovorans]
MRIEASCALNFLIYIQNIFINQNNIKEEYRFPYVSSKMAFDKEFLLKFEELWNEVSERICDDHINSERIFYDEEDLFYNRLFANSTCSFKDYRGIYKAFKVWWSSFAGKFSIERSIDEKSNGLYEELASSLYQKGITPKKELSICLVYDKCLLVDLEVTSYFAVIPIKNFYVNYKDLVHNLVAHIVEDKN